MQTSGTRILFTDDVFDGEPPLGAIVDDARHAGLRIRRRHRIQATAGGVAVLTALAVGLPAALADAGNGGGGGHTLIGAPPSVRPSTVPSAQVLGGFREVPVPPGLTLPLRDITVAPRHLTGDRVPITAKAQVQELLDALPAGTTRTDELLGGVGIPYVPSATAMIESVTVGGRSGSVLVNLSRAGQPKISCAVTGWSDWPQPQVCTVFTHPDGTRVMEEVLGSTGASTLWPGDDYQYEVAVQRADGIVVTVVAYNYSDMGGPVSDAPPLTFDQVAAIAAEPTWAWSAPRSYVQAAEHLDVPGQVTWPQ